MGKISMLIPLVVIFILVACSGQPTVTSLPAEDVTPVATVRRVDAGITKVVSNGIITFTDSASGISLDYPEGWIMDQVRGGTRSPSVFVFTNYFHIPALMDKIPPDESAVYLTILQPNPEATLPGLVDSYKQQWTVEGSTIVTEENVTLVSGQAGTAILLDSYLGRQYYYLFTAVGDKLLFIEAIGDLAPVPAIAMTVR